MTDLRRLLALALLLAVPGAALAQEPPAPAPPAAPAAVAAPAQEPYLRIREEADGVVVLEIASRVFLPPGEKGPRIHLVSAVHVADAPFYADAQARLDRFDLVLFEGVRPAGAGSLDASATPERRLGATKGRLDLLRTVAEQMREESGAFPADREALVGGAGKRRASLLKVLLADGWGRPIRYERRPAAAEVGGPPEAAVFTSDGPDGKADAAGAAGDDLRVEAVAAVVAAPGAAKGPGIQAELAKALGLAFQLDAMDTSKPNWRGSDMSVDELQERMRAAGADSKELLSLLDGTSFSARMVRVFLGMIAKAPKMAAMAKLAIVEALAATGGNPGGMAAPGGLANMGTVMRVVIEDRNAVVLADLRAVVAKEPACRDVAVFYGAGHMADLERRLVADLGYRAGETAWAAALRADPKEAGLSPEQARAMRATMRKMVEKQLGGK